MICTVLLAQMGPVEPPPESVCKSKQDLGAPAPAVIASPTLALNKWTKDETNRGRGITLELSIHCQSEDKGMPGYTKVQNIYRFNPFEWTGRERLDEDDSWTALSQAPLRQAGSDLVHGISGPGHPMTLGRLGVYVTPSFRGRPDADWPVLKSWPSGLVILEKLRPCNVITGFLMRREYHRCVSPHGLGTILDKLPALEHMNYEMWQLDETPSRGGSRLSTEYIVLFGHRMPPSLRRLSVFQDFDKLDLYISPHMAPSRRDLPPPAHRALGQALARSSSNLEELSVAFLVDAKDLFYQFQPLSVQEEVDQEWKNLTTLSLTSTDLRGPEESAIWDLLEAAANAARRMPELQTMEIWNASCGEGAIFRYERRHEGTGSPVITCITSWWAYGWPSIDPRVITAWERVVPQGEKLTVSMEVMAAPKSYGCLLASLKLRDRMLHPMSLFQIELAMKNISP